MVSDSELATAARRATQKLLTSVLDVAYYSTQFYFNASLQSTMRNNAKTLCSDHLFLLLEKCKCHVIEAVR